MVLDESCRQDHNHQDYVDQNNTIRNLNINPIKTLKLVGGFYEDLANKFKNITVFNNSG